MGEKLAAERVLAEIAAAALDLGILRPEDWYGSLPESLQSGLVRWFDFEMGAAGWRHLQLSLAYTDDADAYEWEEDEGYFGTLCGSIWASRHAQKRERPIQVGWFGLACGSSSFEATYGQEVVVGPRIRELEALAPGAGYSVLGLLANALANTVVGITPEWGLRFLDWHGGFSGREDDDDELQELWERPTSARDAQRLVERAKRLYRRGIPKGVWTAKWRPAPVKRALKACTFGQEHLEEILEGALALARYAPHVQKFGDLNEWPDFSCHGEELVAPVLVRWSERDLLPRVYDDYMQGAMEMAGYSLVTFARGFEADRPESIRRCLEGLKLGVEIVARCEALLDQLHSPEASVEVQVPERVMVRV